MFTPIFIPDTHTHEHRIKVNAMSEKMICLRFINGDPRDGLFHPTLTLTIYSYINSDMLWHKLLHRTIVTDIKSNMKTCSFMSYFISFLLHFHLRSSKNWLG